jgi:hypothetical protein
MKREATMEAADPDGAAVKSAATKSAEVSATTMKAATAVTAGRSVGAERETAECEHRRQCKDYFTQHVELFLVRLPLIFLLGALAVENARQAMNRG